MNPSRAFILRPVGTALLMAAIMLVGLVALRFLPLSALPEVDYPTIQVQTFYPGASPEVMTNTVTAPLERQFGEMTDLNRMSSISAGGSCVLVLHSIRSCRAMITRFRWQSCSAKPWCSRRSLVHR